MSQTTQHAPGTVREPGSVCETYRRFTRRWSLLYLAVILVGTLVTIGSYRYFGSVSFRRPDFEEQAAAGFPQVEEKRYGFTPLEIEKGYRVFLCGMPANDGQNVEFNIANPQDNEVWLRVELVAENGDLLGSTGVLKQGEYLPAIRLKEPLTQQETPMAVRIISYEPHKWTSRGNVTLNVTVLKNFR